MRLLLSDWLQGGGYKGLRSCAQLVTDQSVDEVMEAQLILFQTMRKWVQNWESSQTFGLEGGGLQLGCISEPSVVGNDMSCEIWKA